jgi:hypothetical protein
MDVPRNFEIKEKAGATSASTRPAGPERLGQLWLWLKLGLGEGMQNPL